MAMSDQLSQSGDALSAYRYSVLGQAGIAITFEQLLDQQSHSRHQSQGQNTTGTPTGTSNDSVAISVSPNASLTEAQSILQRMRSLSFQAASGTSTSGSDAQIQQELHHLQAQLDQLSAETRSSQKGSVSAATVKSEAAKVADDVERKKTAEERAAKKAADQKAADLVNGDGADAKHTSKTDHTKSADRGSKTSDDKTRVDDDTTSGISSADQAESVVLAARGQLRRDAREALHHQASVSAPAAEALLRS
jgi:flagellin